LIIFNCNNNGISSSGDCNATLYNGPDNSRTNVGNVNHFKIDLWIAGIASDAKKAWKPAAAKTALEC